VLLDKVSSSAMFMRVESGEGGRRVFSETFWFPKLTMLMRNKRKV
jgi:hypothetical protein